MASVICAHAQKMTDGSRESLMELVSNFSSRNKVYVELTLTISHAQLNLGIFTYRISLLHCPGRSPYCVT